MEYFLSGLNYESNKKRSTETTQQIHKDFEVVFNGIRCFDGTFTLQLRPDSKPYQVSLRHMAYTLQKTIPRRIRKTTKRGQNSTSRG